MCLTSGSETQLTRLDQLLTSLEVVTQQAEASPSKETTTAIFFLTTEAREAVTALYGALKNCDGKDDTDQ